MPRMSYLLLLLLFLLWIHEKKFLPHSPHDELKSNVANANRIYQRDHLILEPSSIYIIYILLAVCWECMVSSSVLPPLLSPLNLYLFRWRIRWLWRCRCRHNHVHQSGATVFRFVLSSSRLLRRLFVCLCVCVRKLWIWVREDKSSIVNGVWCLLMFVPFVRALFFLSSRLLPFHHTIYFSHSISSVGLALLIVAFFISALFPLSNTLQICIFR